MQEKNIKLLEFQGLDLQMIKNLLIKTKLKTKCINKNRYIFIILNA